MTGNTWLTHIIRSKALWLGVAAAVVVVTLYLFNPVGNWWMPQCPFRLLTGWKCPGCGVMRATHSLTHLRLAEAWSYNYMLPVMVALAAAILLCLRSGSAGGRRLVRVLTGIYVGLFALWWVLRNILGC